MELTVYCLLFLFSSLTYLIFVSIRVDALHVPSFRRVDIPLFIPPFLDNQTIVLVCLDSTPPPHRCTTIVYRSSMTHTRMAYPPPPTRTHGVGICTTPRASPHHIVYLNQAKKPHQRCQTHHSHRNQPAHRTTPSKKKKQVKQRNPKLKPEKREAESAAAPLRGIETRVFFVLFLFFMFFLGALGACPFFFLPPGGCEWWFKGRCCGCVLWLGWAVVEGDW